MTHEEDEVTLGVNELNDRQVLITILKRMDAHNTWMENFMSNLSPEFTDLTNAVTLMLAAFSSDNGTISSQLAQIADLNAQIATVTAQDTTDAASAAAALAQVADLNAQIATLTATAAAQAAAAETAATTLTAALPAATPPPPPPPAAFFSFIGADPTTIDTSVWPVVGADANGAPVYGFSGDVSTIDATQWVAYTGVVTPAPTV